MGISDLPKRGAGRGTIFPPNEPDSGHGPNREADHEQDDGSGDVYDELPVAYVAHLVHEFEQVVTASRRTIAIRLPPTA